MIIGFVCYIAFALNIKLGNVNLSKQMAIASKYIFFSSFSFHLSIEGQCINIIYYRIRKTSKINK